MINYCTFSSEVFNGGLHQFLYNSSGDIFEEVIGALYFFRIRDVAVLLEDIKQKFPNGNVSTSRRKRQKELNALGEIGELFDKETAILFDNMDSLDIKVSDFLKKNIELFL